MSNFPIETIADRLVAGNKNVLILDTCCILDIIRCIQRENLNTLKAAIEIIELYDKKQNNFEMVLPSVVGSEWSDHCISVKTETENHIKKSDSVLKNLGSAVEIIYSLPVKNTYFSQLNLENILYDSSEKVKNLSLCLERKDVCILNAHNRVMLHIPPAAQGKDSFKDCTVFEETLLLGSLLRNKGFTKKIIFATSNTKEYLQDKKPIPQIVTDLKVSNIDIVYTLSHGLHLAQS